VKSDEVAQFGARVASSPAEAAADVDVVMLSLADQDVVASMLRGTDRVFGSLRQAATSQRRSETGKPRSVHGARTGSASSAVI